MVENPLDDGHVYIVGNLQGDAVAGITFQLPEMADHPAFWNVYLAADDVDAVAARVGPAGGDGRGRAVRLLRLRADGRASRTRRAPG